MSRASFSGSTVCYLENDNKILFLRFHQKWNGRHCAPGGKLEFGESPLEGVKREFLEETGLTLINPKLKGIAQWVANEKSGFIFVFYCKEATGELASSNIEGSLEWVDIDKINDLNEFAINKKLREYIFNPNCGIFEGKFVLDEKDEIVEFNINQM